MPTSKLIPIKVVNKKSLGQLSGETVYLTTELKKYLENEKTKSGDTLFSLFKKGMALRGFKHLVETIRLKDKKGKIVFTNENKVFKQADQYRIDYQTYRRTTSSRFFTLYRETGLESAKYFLNTHFSDQFKYEKNRISEKDIKKVENKFPEIIKNFASKTKHQKTVLEVTGNIIKELKDKKEILQSEIKSLEQIQNESNIFIFQEKIKELELRIPKSYPETKGKNSWQNWIYKNNWLFGINYQEPIEKQKINISGSMPDYLFPTIDGFLDILEIKLPSEAIILDDPSHPGSYRWCTETNKAIGQVVNYLINIELYQLHLTQEINRAYKTSLSIIKPRAFILIGSQQGWSKEKIEALRKLNYSLHGIEVLTYSDLIKRGNEIVQIYTKKL